MSDHSQHPANEGGRLPCARFIVIAVCAVLGLVFWEWCLDLRWRAETLAAQVRRLDGRWAIVSANLEAARNVQTRDEAFLNSAKRVLEEGNEKRWTRALRSIAISRKAGIEIRGLRVVQTSNDSPIYSLQIEGVSKGSAPRAIADKFLQTLRSDLGRQFQVTEPVRFAELEDLTEPAAESGDEKATFTITTTISLAKAITSESKRI